MLWKPAIPFVVLLACTNADAGAPGRRLANAVVNAQTRTLRLEYPGPLQVWARGFAARNEDLLRDAIRSQIPQNSSDSSLATKAQRQTEADKGLVENIDAIGASTAKRFGSSPPPASVTPPGVVQPTGAVGTRTTLQPGQ